MEKKNLILTILISVICSTLFSLIIFSLIRSSEDMSINDFNVSNFSYTSEKVYGTNYYGNAKITCPKKTGTYVVVYSKKLVSGGSYENIGKEEYEMCIVHNGEGSITTFDYANEGENIIEPVYEIKLLGYRSFY